MPKNVVGDSRYFVTGKGFVQVRTFDAILAQDGTKRLFAELTADHDAPRTRVDVALKWLLNSLRPGWVMRFVQTYWQDPEPRVAFVKHVEERMNQTKGNAALEVLHDGMYVFLMELGVSFGKRTFIEFVIINKSCVDFWETIPGTLYGYGVMFNYLNTAAVSELTRSILNPVLEE